MDNLQQLEILEQRESKVIWLTRAAIIFSYASPVGKMLAHAGSSSRFMNTTLPLISFWALLAVLVLLAIAQDGLGKQLLIIKKQTTIPIRKLYSYKILVIAIPVWLTVMTYTSENPTAGFVYGMLAWLLFEIIMYFRRKQYDNMRELLRNN